MSAPPLIRPPSKPASRMKLPGLKIPPQARSLTPVISPPDEDIDIINQGSGPEFGGPLPGFYSSNSSNTSLPVPVPRRPRDGINSTNSSSTGLHLTVNTNTETYGSYSSSGGGVTADTIGGSYGSYGSYGTVTTTSASLIIPPDNNNNNSSSSSTNRSPSSAVSGLFSAEILAAVKISDDNNTPTVIDNDSMLVDSITTNDKRLIADNSLSTSNSVSNSGYTTPNSGGYLSQNNRGIVNGGHEYDVEDLDEEGWATVARQGEITDLGRLGEGAGGSVSRCRLKNGKTIFALKEITTNPNPELQKQILRELQFNRSCNSPHIVKYYGTFLSNEFSSIFIAMEYCGGGSLEAIYKRVKARRGRIGEKVLGKIAEGVLSGLSYLHERKIIHRDIKPQNILLDSQGQVKLCDFGVSGEVVDSLATTFTGTSYYMAPERIQGQPYTVTSDVWSLGLTLMEVAQHRFPFLPEDHDPLMPIELLTFIVNMPAPELQDEPEEGIKWSDTFRHFLSCCLEKDPKRRASPRQMLNHPWMIGQRSKTVKMDKFVKECWS